MLFNSPEFLLFLPIVFGLYWFVVQRNLMDILPRRYFYPSLNQANDWGVDDCLNSSSIASSILCLPVYHTLEMDATALPKNHATLLTKKEVSYVAIVQC